MTHYLGSYLGILVRVHQDVDFISLGNHKMIETRLKCKACVRRRIFRENSFICVEHLLEFISICLPKLLSTVSQSRKYENCQKCCIIIFELCGFAIISLC